MKALLASAKTPASTKTKKRKTLSVEESCTLALTAATERLRKAITERGLREAFDLLLDDYEKLRNAYDDELCANSGETV